MLAQKSGGHGTFTDLVFSDQEFPAGSKGQYPSRYWSRSHHSGHGHDTQKGILDSHLPEQPPAAGRIDPTDKVVQS